nr:hypothetical protein [uncultured Arsenicibacter sp.]
MKTYINIIALIGLTAGTVFAQDSDKLKKDVTYSTHNYKHANKAATARQWEQKKSVTVTAPALNQNQVANYKQPVPGAAPVGGVSVNHTPQVTLAERNYKIQRGNSNPQTAQPTGDAVAQTEKEN